MKNEKYELIVRKHNGKIILNAEFDDVCIAVIHSWETDSGWRKSELCYSSLTEEN